MAEGRRVYAAWFLLLILFNLFCGDLCSKFSIGHINVCGLLWKIDLFSLFIVEQKFNIFCVSETLLKILIPSYNIDVPGFVFERKDRGDTGGGVGIYLKGDINYLRRRDFENAETEFMFRNFTKSLKAILFVCFV